MAQDSRSYGVSRDVWLRLLPPLAANALDFPHLESPRLQLESISNEVGLLLAQQAELAASRQDISKRLKTLITEGRQLAAFLRAGVKQRYGTRSEKLTAFNLQPFRGRKIKSLEEEAPSVDAPTSPASK